jgi:hypothetical protein
MTPALTDALLRVPPDWTDLAAVKARFPAQLAPQMVSYLLSALEVAGRVETRKAGSPPRVQIRLTPGKPPA